MPNLKPETVSTLVEKLTAQVRETLERTELPENTGVVAATPEQLPRAIARLRSAEGQVAILRSLLAGASSLGGRAALFVAKPSGLEGWEAVGFEDVPNLSAGVRGVVIAGNEPAVERVIVEKAPVMLGEGLPVPDFGQGHSSEARFVPLVLSDSVVGVVYVDATEETASLDVAGLDSLGLAASLSIENLALSRMTADPPAAAATPPPPSVSEPAAENPSAPTPQPEPAEIPATSGEYEIQMPDGFADDDAELAIDSPAADIPATPPPSPAPAHELSLDAEVPADPEIEDARRFARLLMEEVLLYNGDKVEQGRSSGDLLARLEEELDRARGMYERRIADDVRSRGDFFHDAIISVLADGDAACLGAGQPAG